MRLLLPIAASGLAAIALTASAKDAGSLWDVEEIPVEGKAPSAIPLQPAYDSKFEGKGEPIFSRLQEGESVGVQFESKGCFNAGTFAVEVRGGENPTARVKTIESDSINPRSGTLRLTPDDLAALDRTFAYYRSPRSGTCTTTNKISFRWRVGEASSEGSGVEEFVDSSCQDSHYDNLLTVPDLVLRLQAEDAE